MTGVVVLWHGFCCDHQRGEDLESGTGGEVESRYKKMYEDDINPFTAFSKKVLFLSSMQGSLLIEGGL